MAATCNEAWSLIKANPRKRITFECALIKQHDLRKRIIRSKNIDLVFRASYPNARLKITNDSNNLYVLLLLTKGDLLCQL